MTTVDITIGWTKSSLPGYSSFSDGYHPGAPQHVETISVDVPADWLAPGELWRVAETVFTATNAPYVEAGSVAAEIAEAIAAAGYHGQGAHYSLSVGDTVTVGEVTLACDDCGWETVSMGGVA